MDDSTGRRWVSFGLPQHRRVRFGLERAEYQEVQFYLRRYFRWRDTGEDPWLNLSDRWAAELAAVDAIVAALPAYDQDLLRAKAVNRWSNAAISRERGMGSPDDIKRRWRELAQAILDAIL